MGLLLSGHYLNTVSITKMVILAYHRVNSWIKNDPLVVPADEFERQISFLKSEGYENIPLRELIERGKKRELPSRGVSVTFDDGYYDSFRFACPILKKYGFTATFFVVANFVGKIHGKDGFPGWNRIKRMVGDDFDIGGHTFSHPHLPHLSDEELKREVANSKKYIKDKSGKRINFFCYPYGEFDERVKDAVKDAGYKAAFFTPSSSGIEEDIYAIRRVGIYGQNSFFLFRLKVSRLSRLSQNINLLFR